MSLSRDYVISEEISGKGLLSPPALCMLTLMTQHITSVHYILAPISGFMAPYFIWQMFRRGK